MACKKGTLTRLLRAAPQVDRCVNYLKITILIQEVKQRRDGFIHVGSYRISFQIKLVPIRVPERHAHELRRNQQPHPDSVGHYILH